MPDTDGGRMSGPRPLHPAVPIALLALALVLAPVAALPVGPAPGDAVADGSAVGAAAGNTAPPSSLGEPVISERNTTGYLALAGPIQQSQFGTATLDVGGAVAADGRQTRSGYERAHLQRAFVDAGNDRTARRAVVNRSADRIEARITGLERRADEALARYNAGTISTRSYLRELAAIDAAANELREAVDLLARYNSAVDEPIEPNRIAAQKARLLPLQGPVRNRVLTTMRGESDPIRVYVETAPEGVVLATIDRGEFTDRYVREAHVPSARDSNGTDRFLLGTSRAGSLERAQERAGELYPWTFDNRGPIDTGSFSGPPFLFLDGVYPVIVDHPHAPSTNGDLRIFLDGATRDVFREVQRKDLREIPTTRAGTNSTQGVTLAVNRTRSGGPMLVSVTSATTGEPLDATVIVNGERLGRTATDGRYWTIAPRPTANVTVVRDDATVTEEVFSDGTPTG